MDFFLKCKDLLHKVLVTEATSSVQVYNYMRPMITNSRSERSWSTGTYSGMSRYSSTRFSTLLHGGAIEIMRAVYTSKTFPMIVVSGIGHQSSEQSGKMTATEMTKDTYQQCCFTTGIIGFDEDGLIIDDSNRISQHYGIFEFTFAQTKVDIKAFAASHIEKGTTTVIGAPSRAAVKK